MMLEWTAALVLAATPTTVMSVSELEESLPKIKQAMTWASQAKPSWSPSRTNRFLKTLKLDLFDVKQWSSLGLNKNRMIYIWDLPDQHANVIELSVKNKKAIDTLLSAALKSQANAQKIIDLPGFWMEPRVGEFLAAVRVKNRLYLQTDRKSGSLSSSGPMAVLTQLLTSKAPPDPKPAGPINFQDERLSALRIVLNHRKPKVSSKRRASTSPIWLHQLDKSHSYLSGPIKLDQQGIKVDLLLSGPTFKDSDVRRSLMANTKSRRLFDTAAILNVGGEVQAHLTPHTMREWGQKNRLNVDASKVWTGKFHIVLMENGSVLAGVPIRNEASKSMRNELAAALRVFDRKLKQIQIEAYKGEGLWLLWWGDVSEKSMRKLVLTSKPIYAETLVLRVDPPLFLRGLKNRSAARDQIRLPGAKLLLIELMAGQLMNSAKKAGAELVVSPGQAELSMQLKY